MESLTYILKRPEWSSLMQMVQKGQHQGQSSALYLQLIEMNPNDLTCVYSTLSYVSSHVKRHTFMHIVTFDQPSGGRHLKYEKCAQR